MWRTAGCCQHKHSLTLSQSFHVWESILYRHFSELTTEGFLLLGRPDVACLLIRKRSIAKLQSAYVLEEGQSREGVEVSPHTRFCSPAPVQYPSASKRQQCGDRPEEPTVGGNAGVSPFAYLNFLQKPFNPSGMGGKRVEVFQNTAGRGSGGRVSKSPL